MTPDEVVRKIHVLEGSLTRLSRAVAMQGEIFKRIDVSPIEEPVKSMTVRAVWSRALDQKIAEHDQRLRLLEDRLSALLTQQGQLLAAIRGMEAPVAPVA